MLNLSIEIITAIAIVGLVFSIVVINFLYFQHDRKWSKLEEYYRFREKIFWGLKLKIKFISVNGRKVQHPVKVMVSRQGLFIKPYYPLRFFSHSILIPWQDVIEVKDYKTESRKRLVLSGSNHLSVEMSERISRHLNKYIIKKDHKPDIYI